MQELALEALQRWHQALARAMAASHGPAFAGGMDLVCACDVVVASVEAVFCGEEALAQHMAGHVTRRFAQPAPGGMQHA